jgi:hypothetical protein
LPLFPWRVSGPLVNPRSEKQEISKGKIFPIDRIFFQVDKNELLE